MSVVAVRNNSGNRTLSLHSNVLEFVIVFVRLVFCREPRDGH